MNEKMNARETWEDFYAWIQEPERKSLLSRKEWDYLRKTNSDVNLSRHVGIFRLEKIFRKHAPGRYVFSGVWSIYS